MSWELIITLLVAIFGSTGLWSLISNILTSRNKRIQCIERDCNRTQLLLLMHDYPQAHEEIMKVAYEYFIKLKGNWYLDSLFTKWLKQEGLEKPSWYTGE